MTTKNRIAIIVSVICLIVSVSLIAIISVWAATQQTVTASVTVTYTSHEIYGTASANWIVGGESTAMTDGQGGTVLNFDAEDETSTKVLTPNLAEDEYIELDETNLYVVFEYKFTNKADHTYSATLTFEGTDDNFNLYYLVYETALTAEQYETKIIDEGDEFVNTLTCEVPINQAGVDGECYVYILIKVRNINQGASFSGDFNWQLQSS